MARSPRLLLLTCLSLLAVACSPVDPPTATTSVPATPASPSQPQFPVTLVDDDGREVRLDGAPMRIVSLAPSNTEIACALDACDRLVGVTDFDDYPPEVADITDVVIGAQVDVEKVVATDPDLVLAGGNELTPSAVIDQLEELDVAVLALYPESLDEVYADIELVGRALGRGDDAQALIDDMRTTADDVSDAVAGADRPRTFYEVSVFEGTIYTAGDGSFLADLIAAAGGEPITGDAVGTIALEDLVDADPELILLGDASYDPSVTPDAVAARPGWSQMSAVQNNRVVSFDDDLIVTRPGPRIVDGLAALARAIHPERFE
jgi:iron complex transport system substrate-binding protein